MSWLRRLFGGGAGEREPRHGEDKPTRAHEPGEGPVYGNADVPLATAKPELLRLLRERGAHSALIVYDGGNDEGWITSFSWSTEPLPAGAESFDAASLPAAQAVDVDAAIDAAGGPDDALFEAAEAVMCDKWGSFAGEFSVHGRLVVDVDAETIVRQDDIWLIGEEDFDELEESDEDRPSRAADTREVETI